MRLTHLQVVAVEDGGSADGCHNGTLCIIVEISDDAIKIHCRVVVDRLPVVALTQIVTQASALAAGEELDGLKFPQ